MNKAKVTSPQIMSEEQLKEDISMSPMERLNLAFQISDFALELHPVPENFEDDPSPIRWIELRIISS